jgi:hypothetical protein
MSFQGSLTDLPLADIVQLVAVSGKTGMFSLTRAAEAGAVYLSSGQIVHANLGAIEGEDAIYSLALWTSGSFQFSPGVEADKQTITRSNTNLLMEAARRSDEWKILSRKIPSTEGVPRLVASERHSGPITLTPQEWAVITRCDGRTTIDEIARLLKRSAFEVAKTLFGLVTAELVEIGKPAPLAHGRTVAPPPVPGDAEIPNVTTHTGVFRVLTRGDEKRSLQILCTKVKQEAEGVLGAPGDAGIDRFYRSALAELDRGRGLDVVRDLIRALEGHLVRVRGGESGSAFRERMSPLL